MFNRRHCNRNKPIYCPPNVFPTQVAPARVSPTQEVVKTNVFNCVVPHVHPTHTTTVNKHITTHEHYFPQTQSTVNQFFENNRVAGAQDFNPMTNPMTSPMSNSMRNPMTSPMSNSMTNPMYNPMTSPMSNTNCHTSNRRKKYGW